MLHIAAHFAVPLLVARLGWPRTWRTAYVIMIATMLVDLDHLLADPIYDPVRCSIGFHPLHTTFPILFYVGLCAIPKLRVVGVGLVIHMVLDGIDCVTG